MENIVPAAVLAMLRVSAWSEALSAALAGTGTVIDVGHRTVGHARGNNDRAVTRRSRRRADVGVDGSGSARGCAGDVDGVGLGGAVDRQARQPGVTDRAAGGAR